jgi:CheY-like chemotaxis protein
MQDRQSPAESVVVASSDEVRLRRTLDRLPAGAYTCDREGRITYFNKRATEIWGREPTLNAAEDRFCGSYRLFRPDGSPIPHDDCCTALALRTNSSFHDQEIVIERPDGRRAIARAYANPLHDESGELAGALNVLVGIGLLPLASGEAEESDGRPGDPESLADGGQQSSPGVSLRILVVDDNHDAAASLGILLRILGNQVRTAHDGLEAIREVESFRPDVVLLDIGLPEMNGYDAAVKIRQLPWGKGLVLIAVTGRGEEKDKQRSKEAGFDYHLVKPIDPIALIRLLAFRE